jgi:hypothetical protein
VNKTWFLGLGAWLLIGCGTAEVSESPKPLAIATAIVTPLTTEEPRPRPTQFPGPTQSGGVPANGCTPEQIAVVVNMLPERGSLGVRVRRTGGTTCVIRISPPASLVDGAGRTLAESWRLPGGMGFYPLESELPFDLSWALVCPGPPLVRPLTASVAFVDLAVQTDVPLPDGFEPACTLSAPVMGFDPGFSYGGESSEGGTGG